ncbi:MAG: hypothetical protein JSR82_24345 [Verrucomicrobia bacterium]|nr:hypothetical protein [Verrucomicrobiota bacterium]
MKSLAVRFSRILAIVAAVVAFFWASGRLIRWADPTSGGVFDVSMLQAFVMATVPFGLSILCAHLVCSVLFTTLRTWLGAKGLLSDWTAGERDPLTITRSGEVARSGVGPKTRVLVFFSFFAFLCALYAFFVFCCVLLLLVPVS